jgi:hypothetical protein
VSADARAPNFPIARQRNQLSAGSRSESGLGRPHSGARCRTGVPETQSPWAAGRCESFASATTTPTSRPCSSSRTQRDKPGRKDLRPAGSARMEESAWAASDVRRGRLGSHPAFWALWRHSNPGERSGSPAGLYVATFAYVPMAPECLARVCSRIDYDRGCDLITAPGAIAATRRAARSCRSRRYSDSKPWLAQLVIA